MVSKSPVGSPDPDSFLGSTISPESREGSNDRLLDKRSQIAGAGVLHPTNWSQRVKMGPVSVARCSGEIPGHLGKLVISVFQKSCAERSP